MTEKRLKVLLIYFVEKEEVQIQRICISKKIFKKMFCHSLLYIFGRYYIFTTYIIRNGVKDFGISL